MGVGTEIKCWFVKPTHPQFTCTNYLYKKGLEKKKVRPKIQQDQLHLAHKHK